MTLRRVRLPFRRRNCTRAGCYEFTATALIEAWWWRWWRATWRA